MQLPPGNWSLQPVATGAAEEVTNLSKPLVQRVASGDSASMQAGTRVNAEQAPKRAMRKPTRLNYGEGRRSVDETSDKRPWDSAGVVALACMYMGTDRNTGSPSSEGA